MPFFVTIKALNIGDVFFLNIVGINIYSREVMTMILSLVPLVPRTSLIFLVFVANLALVVRRLLVFTTNYVSRRSVSEFSSFKVFFLLFCWFVPLGTF